MRHSIQALQMAFAVDEPPGSPLHADNDNPLRGSAARTTTPQPASEFGAFGQRVDGREKDMARIVWRAVVNLRRECPIKPVGAEANGAMMNAYNIYLMTNGPRLSLADADGLSGIEAKAALLEREGRGLALLTEKWSAAMAQWDGKVALAAAEPAPAHDEQGPDVDGNELEERFKIETIADLMSQPPPTWLCKGWIPDGSTGVFYGHWGTYKSFIALDLGLHIAHSTQDWHGNALPEDGGDVLIIAREGASGFSNRIRAWMKYHEIAEPTTRLRFMRRGVAFNREADFDGLSKRIQATGIRYRLIIIDTVARVLPGAEINKPETITLFMDRCAALAEVTGAAVLAVHHENKSGGMMGSIYFENNSDFVFQVTKPDGDAEARRGEIICTKMKDGADQWKQSFSLKLVPLSVLGDVSSLVVESIGGGSTHAPDGLPAREVCERMLKTVDRFWQSGKPLSHTAQAKTYGKYAPAVLANEFRRDKVTEKQAKELLDRWLTNDVLSFDMADTKTKLMGLRVARSLDEVVRG